MNKYQIASMIRSEFGTSRITVAPLHLCEDYYVLQVQDDYSYFPLDEEIFVGTEHDAMTLAWAVRDVMKGITSVSYVEGTITRH